MKAKGKPFDRSWLRKRKRSWRCPLAPRRWWPFHSWGRTFHVMDGDRKLTLNRCRRCKVYAIRGHA